MSSRAAATQILVQVLQQGHSLTASVPAYLEGLADERDRALARELCFGVLRWLPLLKGILTLLLKKPLRKRDADMEILLLVGLYQLIYTRIPPYAAVAETVAVANLRGKSRTTGLINALLRNFLRDRERLLARAAHADQRTFSHPAWLVNLLEAAWPEDWQAILQANNQNPPLTLRVNARRTTRAAYLQILREAGVEACPAPYTQHGVTLVEALEVNRLPGFQEGLVSVQDAAAQLAAENLDLQPGQRVLDACAAPGGKSAHLLEIQDRLQDLVAVDRDASRLLHLQQNFRRLDLAARVVCADLCAPLSWWDGVDFDRILLDAPCSATGVIRRHPDIKWLRRPTDIPRLAAQQAQMLDALWPLLAPQGLLLYATCSILPAENEQQVQDFLARHKDAAERPLKGPWGRKRSLGRQILPGAEGMDGFYYALLEKHG